MLKKSLFYVSIVSFFTVSCLFSSAVDAKDTLVIGKQDDTVSLDPAKAYEQGSYGILSLVYEKLVNFDGDDYSQVVPELAESWKIGDDGKTWTFHLRQDVQFSNGNPLNADAVVFSLRRAISLASTSSWMLTQLGMAEESITKIDDHTIQIVLDQQYAPGLVLASLTPPVASILDPKAVMEHEQTGDMGSAWLEEHSAGSGPFTIAQQQRGEVYSLQANPFYWGDKPSTEHIIVKNIQDPFEQLAMLETGEIDLAWNLQPEQINILMDAPEDFQIYQAQTFVLSYVAMNLGYEPLASLEIRNAIRYAIDYDGIIDLILQGAGRKIQTFIPPILLGYNSSMPYKQNLEKARELLAEGGYPDGFTVELMCANYSPWSDVAVKIGNDLAEVGISVKIHEEAPDELMRRAWTGARDFQMYIWEWGFDYPDPDSIAKPFAHSESLEDDATIQAMAWWCNYLNPETSILVEQAARELDTEKRAALYQQITDIILHDGPLAVMYIQIHQYGARSEVADLLGTPSTIWLPFPFLK